MKRILLFASIITLLTSCGNKLIVEQYTIRDDIYIAVVEDEFIRTDYKFVNSLPIMTATPEQIDSLKKLSYEFIEKYNKLEK
ncbi:hypothetical protein M0Q50_02395 [bacterium]|jgi:hypothetical protein|nr:hypothetical protein [bacterium]